VDPLDFAIYRFLSPDGEARFWVGRRIIDPRIPAREIAARVGISENGVRVRLQGLARQGILRGRAVIPNPSLFGVSVFVAELPVREVADVERIYRDLGLVDGVVFARDTMDEGERRLQIHLVAENEAIAGRRVALLRRLSPTGEVGGPRSYWIPLCELEMTPLDWRVLDAVVQHPEATIAETARAVGIGLKTAGRRYHQLLDRHACWWTHGPDSDELPLAFLRLELASPGARGEVAHRIQDLGVPWMPVAADGYGVEPGSDASVLAGLIPADSPARLERDVRRFGGLPGVVRVRRTFALGSMPYPSWFRDRIREHLPRRPPAPRSPTAK
jgi:DNA-binding Lrp family transcriptional regulator